MGCPKGLSWHIEDAFESGLVITIEYDLFGVFLYFDFEYNYR